MYVCGTVNICAFENEDSKGDGGIREKEKGDKGGVHTAAFWCLF